MLAERAAEHTLAFPASESRRIPTFVGLSSSSAVRVGPRVAPAQVALFATEVTASAVIALAVVGATRLAALLVVLAVASLAILRRSPLRVRLEVRRDAPVLAAAAVLSSLAISPTLLATHAPLRAWVAPYVMALAVAVTRAVAYPVIRSARRRGHLLERVLVVGDPSTASAVVHAISRHPEGGWAVAGECSVVDLTAERPERTVDLTALERGLARREFHQVIVALPRHADADLDKAIEVARAGAAATYLVGTAEYAPAHERIGDVALQLVPRPGRVSMTAKRRLDATVAAVMLLALAPLLAIIAIAVRLSSRGPILYRQKRLGQYGRLIDVIKFRTFPHAPASEHQELIENGGAWTVQASESPIALGRLLRRTSLDELPQLWNVLRGDMSLVGPRPERPHLAEALAEMVEGYKDRHRVPVGLTGLAQVNGLWGATSIDDRVMFDNLYIEHWSLRQDLAIILRTIPELLRRARSG